MTGPAGPPLYLLTCHGTLLSLDPDSATIRHVPIDQFDGQGGFVTVDAAPAMLARFTLRGQPHPQGQGIAFRSPQGFLSAELNGSTRLGAATPLAWECFLPISAADIACLRDIMRTTWRLRGTGRMVPPRQIGFSTEFRFHVGDVCLDLRERLPVERFASRDQLIYRAAPVIRPSPYRRIAPTRRRRCRPASGSTRSAAQATGRCNILRPPVYIGWCRAR